MECKKLKCRLIQVKKSHMLLKQYMDKHYSKPKGFVGRSIIYQIAYENFCYGFIAGGSATLHLPGRNEYFNILLQDNLQNIVNNTFFHLESSRGYPFRNFALYVLKVFRYSMVRDWFNKYGDEVIGFETLVELPRTGEIYRRDKWVLIGQTKGFTCKRGSKLDAPYLDSWDGGRIWDTINLRPKLVFCKKTPDGMKEIKL